MNYEYALMDEEIAKFNEFMERHSSCDPVKRDAILEETMDPSFYEITLRVTSIGAVVFAKCLVCGRSEDISCDERIENF
jgi:hypothetical protein